MSVPAADLQWQAGREAFRLACGEDAMPRRRVEGQVPDARLLQSAREHLEVAASLLEAEGRVTDEARLRVDLAEVYLNMPPTDDTCASVEANCRAALDVLDTAQDRDTGMKAYVLLVEAMALHIGHAQGGVETEERIKQTLRVLCAADYLAVEQNDVLLRTRIDETLSRVLGQQFRGDRDANLLEAIRAGYRALPGLSQALATSPLGYPALQVHLGNCYMKLDGPRMRWLREGLAAYKDGLAVVDRGAAPRLHDVLARNVAMTEALIASGNGSLPEEEVMLRFGAKLQATLDRGDADGAQATAWDTIRWAWSLDRAPNVWLAEAHKLLGMLLLHIGDARQAPDHFYSAAALLSALPEPGGPKQAALLEGARQLLRQAMAKLDRADQAAELVRQADGAFVTARQHCARGSQLIASDPMAALEEFERALALFRYDPITLFYRGAAFMNSSRPEAARGDFDRVLALQPRNLRALANRAVVKAQLGDTDGALADCGYMLEIDPQNAAALYNRSLLHVAAGNVEAAIEDLNQLTAAHPNVAEAHALRAKCLEGLNQPGST